MFFTCIYSSAIIPSALLKSRRAYNSNFVLCTIVWFQEEVILHFNLSFLPTNKVFFKYLSTCYQYLTITTERFVIKRNLLKHPDVEPTFLYSSCDKK